MSPINSSNQSLALFFFVLPFLTATSPALKVSKSQKHFFLKLHCPKYEQNIRQDSALEFKKWLN
jgi:hypothetical protein